MNGSGCKTCPEVSCDCVYRGSICKERRAEHGLGDPMTNADRIRAMSDEELADVVANGVGCVRKAPHCMDDDCTPCIFKWLKQPVEEQK